jgi:hypothetical protein
MDMGEIKNNCIIHPAQPISRWGCFPQLQTRHTGYGEKMPIQGEKGHLVPYGYCGQNEIRDAERSQTLSEGAFLYVGHISPDVRRYFQARQPGHKGAHLSAILPAKTGKQFRLDEPANARLTLFQETIEFLRCP